MGDDEYGPWQGWNGGECPVEPDAEIEICVSDFGSRKTTAHADWDWSHKGYSDIIAYRVKREPVVETVRKEANVTPSGWILTGHADGFLGASIYCKGYTAYRVKHEPVVKTVRASTYRNGYTVYETRDGIPDMTTLRWEDAE